MKTVHRAGSKGEKYPLAPLLSPNVEKEPLLHQQQGDGTKWRREPRASSKRSQQAGEHPKFPLQRTVQNHITLEVRALKKEWGKMKNR